MSGFFGAVITWLLDTFFGKPAKLTMEAAQAAQAAEFKAKLETLENDNAKVQKADAARDAVDRAVSTDDGMRKYLQTDPNNRDNG